MREIKFELVGRNVKFNEIVREVVTLQQLIDGNYNRSTLSSFFDTNNGNCEFIAARQWTDLWDKNMVAVFDGDIGQFIGRDGELVRGRVSYYAGEWLVYMHPLGSKHWFDGYVLIAIFEGKYFPSEQGHPFEVIGNVYSNPELIK